VLPSLIGRAHLDYTEGKKRWKARRERKSYRGHLDAVKEKKTRNRREKRGNY